MNPYQNRKLTPYPDINALICDWMEGITIFLSGNIVGLYLSGSLTYGDFVPGRSDIDLQAVVQYPLNKHELEWVGYWHRNLNERYPAWHGRLECSYVPLELMAETRPPKTPRPWWGFDTLYPDAPAGNEWIINNYLLSKYGITLTGPDFNTLIPPIDIQEVRKASARDLLTEWEPKIHDYGYLSNSHNLSYLVLNLCRILFTVLGGEPGSKKAAADWTKTTYPDWKHLIEEADQWNYTKEMKRSDDVIAMIRFSIRIINETGILN
jgi:hypothetical protein